MSFQNELARAIQIAPLPALASDLRAVAHKFLHPMAAILAKLTGVPIDEIRDYQEGKDDGTNGARKPARKTRPRLAKASRSLPAGAARLRAKRGGMVLKQGKRGNARTLRKRTGKRPVSGESV